jgi:hypothetical protein
MRTADMRVSSWAIYRYAHLPIQYVTSHKTKKTTQAIVNAAGDLEHYHTKTSQKLLKNLFCSISRIMSFTVNNSLALLPEAAYLHYRLSHPSFNGSTHAHKVQAHLPMEEVYKPVFRARPSSKIFDIPQVHPFFASSSSSGQEWQCENDLPYRRMMIAEM